MFFRNWLFTVMKMWYFIFIYKTFWEDNKLKKLLDQAMMLKKEQPLFFFLTATKYAVSFLFFISIMIPFYSASALGITARFTLFNMKAWFIYFIVFLGIGIVYLFMILMNKVALAKTIYLVNLIIAAVLFLFFLLIMSVDKSDTPSYVNFSLGLGFFLDLILIAAMAILHFKPTIPEKLLVKLFKINPNVEVVSEVVPSQPVEVVEVVVEEPKEPEPVKEVAPEPVKEVAPEPVKEVAPEPVKEVAPEPVKEVAPEPVKEVAPEPVEEEVIQEKPEEKVSE